MPKSTCKVHTFGQIDYQKAWDLQNQYAAEIAAGLRPPTLLMLEHPHTYTFGRRGEAANLLWDQAELDRRGISVHWVDRGGDVTYHGPGQLVGYPLLPLGYPLLPLGSPSLQKVDYIGYIRKLERVIITAVAEFGVLAKQVEGLTGVWVEGDRSALSGQSPLSGQSASILKLAAIGVKVNARGISRHGFALNVNPDMGYWEGIVGCGLPYPETSLAELLDPVPEMEGVLRCIAEVFGDSFDYEISYIA